jgi:hypothetical protein
MNINGYCTLADYKLYTTARGQTASTDTNDDAVISDLITYASRYIDTHSNRFYFPMVETHLFDLPYSYRENIILDGDLLEVTSFTNGDGVAISSSNYLLKSTRPPYWAISLRDTSTVGWTTSAAGSVQQVLSLIGTWGYHDNYAARAWLQVGTLSAAITDTTTLAFSATTGHSIVAGNVLKIGSEIYNVVTAGTNTITPVARGDNGSTAATHLISTAIYAWQPMEGAKESALELSNSLYNKRFGKSTGDSAVITAAGVILTPQDVPATVKMFIKKMERHAWR